MRRHLLLAVIAAAALLAGGIWVVASIAARTAPGDRSAAAGRVVFAQAGCGGCHVLAAGGGRGTRGPDLDEASPPETVVERQVTRGGGGMPAFADRLSADQIAAVAAFVSANATGRAPDGAPRRFRPSASVPGDCADGDRACLEQAYGNVAYRRGGAAALAVLARDTATGPLLLQQCHRITHGIGGAAVARARGDVGRALVDGSPVCGSGYYHGVLERALARVPVARLGGAVRRLCASREVRREVFVTLQCLHGLGHGLMLRTGLDLPRALDGCGALAVPTERRSCESGVFMENIFTSYGGTSPWVRDDDPLYPCTEVARPHKSACYSYSSSRILALNGRNYVVAARTCRQAEPGYVRHCLTSLGRDVSADHDHDPARVARACARLADAAPECFYGAARNQFNNDGSPRRTIALCDLASGRARRECFIALGTYYPLRLPWASQGTAACRGVGLRADRQACAEGVRMRLSWDEREAPRGPGRQRA